MKMDSKHVSIVREILSRYPYGFYLFGSRAKHTSYEFSDLDICFFEEIPAHILHQIEHDLAESDLPYKVDLVDWHNVDTDFQKNIINHIICFQISESMIRASQNFLGRSLYFPKALGMKLSQYNNVTIINTELDSSLFNIAFGVANNEDIIHIIDQFQHKSFTWWIPPHLISNTLHTQLLDHGFTIKPTEYAMICDLDVTRHINHDFYKLTIEEVLDDKKLKDFVEVIASQDQTSYNFYSQIKPFMLLKQQKLYVGYEKQTYPCAVGILFCNNENSSAGISGIFIKEDRRGEGYGKDMVMHLMLEAKNKKLNYVTLNSSKDAYSIYENFGFRTIGKFDCFEWKKRH